MDFLARSLSWPICGIRGLVLALRCLHSGLSTNHKWNLEDIMYRGLAMDVLRRGQLVNMCGPYPHVTSHPASHGHHRFEIVIVGGEKVDTRCRSLVIIERSGLSS
ncbi:unnamed protein product [Cercospora beticola]|nr:unnamed protein product [Cercospora beticola]